MKMQNSLMTVLMTIHYSLLNKIILHKLVVISSDIVVIRSNITKGIGRAKALFLVRASDTRSKDL